jgi:hypothetical protein
MLVISEKILYKKNFTIKTKYSGILIYGFLFDERPA